MRLRSAPLLCGAHERSRGPRSQLQLPGVAGAVLALPQRLVLLAQVPAGEPCPFTRCVHHDAHRTLAPLTRTRACAGLLALPPRLVQEQRLRGRAGEDRAQVCALDAQARQGGRRQGRRGGPYRAQGERSGRPKCSSERGGA